MAFNQITVASAQFDPKILDLTHNLDKIAEMTKKAAQEHGADLIVFPEAAITGYGFASREEAFQAGIVADGPELAALHRLAEEEGITIVVGAVERLGDEVFNTVFCLEPDGAHFFYHKSHLPYLGVDRFAKAGNCPVAIFDTRFGKIGILVCYELRFPEPARMAALAGARLLLQPTNLPEGGESHPDFLTRTRACENRVHFVSSNRVGIERGFPFIGRSQIVDYNGNVLAECGRGEEIISQTLDLIPCENKDIISHPGERELYLFRHRRWELYGPLAQRPNEEGYLT